MDQHTKRSSDIKGYLLKQTPKGDWQKRYAEVNGNFFTLFKSPKDTKMLAAIALDQVGEIKILREINDTRGNGIIFTIDLKEGRYFTLRVPTLPEAEHWINSLKYVRNKFIAASKKKQGVQDYTPPSPYRKYLSQNTTVSELSFSNEQEENIHMYFDPRELDKQLPVLEANESFVMPAYDPVDKFSRTSSRNGLNELLNSPTNSMRSKSPSGSIRSKSPSGSIRSFSTVTSPVGKKQKTPTKSKIFTNVDNNNSFSQVEDKENVNDLYKVRSFPNISLSQDDFNISNNDDITTESQEKGLKNEKVEKPPVLEEKPKIVEAKKPVAEQLKPEVKTVEPKPSPLVTTAVEPSPVVVPVVLGSPWRSKLNNIQKKRAELSVDEAKKNKKKKVALDNEKKQFSWKLYLGWFLMVLSVFVTFGSLLWILIPSPRLKEEETFILPAKPKENPLFGIPFTPEAFSKVDVKLTTIVDGQTIVPKTEKLGKFMNQDLTRADLISSSPLTKDDDKIGAFDNFLKSSDVSPELGASTGLEVVNSRMKKEINKGLSREKKNKFGLMKAVGNLIFFPFWATGKIVSSIWRFLDQ